MADPQTLPLQYTPDQPASPDTLKAQQMQALIDRYGGNAVEDIISAVLGAGKGALAGGLATGVLGAGVGIPAGPIGMGAGFVGGYPVGATMGAVGGGAAGLVSAAMQQQQRNIDSQMPPVPRYPAQPSLEHQMPPMPEYSNAMAPPAMPMNKQAIVRALMEGKQ